MKISLNITNKQTGLIIIIIALVLFPVIYSLTSDLLQANEVLHQGCNLPEQICPFIKFPHQSTIAFGIDIVLLLFGIILILSSKHIEKVSIKNKTEMEKTVRILPKDEKDIYKIIADSDGAIFQSELVEKTGLSKVKISRALDKLEGRGIIERRRRGMSNVVILKHK